MICLLTELILFFSLFGFLLSLVTFKCREKKVSDLGISLAQMRHLKLRKCHCFSRWECSLFTGVSVGFSGCDKACSVQVGKMLALQTRTKIVVKFMHCIRKL